MLSTLDFQKRGIVAVVSGIFVISAALMKSQSKAARFVFVLETGEETVVLENNIRPSPPWLHPGLHEIVTTNMMS